MHNVGFDLGSSSLKVVEASRVGAKLHAVQAFEYVNPFGIMLPADEVELQQLAAMVKQVLVEHKVDLTNVRTAIPESLISSKIVNTPPLSDAELASAIDWLAEQHIAIPLDEVKVEYEVLYRPGSNNKDENMRVMLIGVPKTVISNHMKFYDLLGIEPTIMETQVVSLLRACVQPEMPTTMVVNMGGLTTDIAIVHQQEIVFTYSFAIGGRLLTRSIEKGLNLTVDQAENYKKSYGIDPQQLEGKLATILDPVMKLFVSEMQKALQFFTSQHGTFQVERIVLSGGSALLAGAVPYFAKNFSQEIIIANPFINLTTDTKTPLPADRSCTFAIATGLAMREK